MDQPPTVIDQKRKLKTMPGGAFVLGDYHCRVFESIAIEITIHISALIVHGMMEAAVPGHAMAVDERHFLNDMRTVGEVGQIAKQPMRLRSRVVRPQEHETEHKTHHDPNCVPARPLHAQMNTGRSSIVRHRPSVHQTCFSRGFFCFWVLSAVDREAVSSALRMRGVSRLSHASTLEVCCFGIRSPQ